MALYKYSAVDSGGKKIKGTLEADNRNQAIGLLKDKRYSPMSIEETVMRKELTLTSIFNRIKTKDIAVFSRQFQVMLVAGIPVVKALDILKHQTENRVLKQRIDSMYESVQKGVSLSRALKNHNDVFPPLYINMVEAGEASGTLDVIMDRLSIHYEKEFKIQNKIKGAMVYPFILTIVSILVVTFLLIFVMPTFMSMFASSGSELPLPTRILMKVSDILRDYWYFVLVNIFFIVYLINLFRRSKRGRDVLDRLKLKIPLVNGNLKKIITSRFTRTLSTLLRSGIPLMDSIEIVSKVVQNKVVEEGLLNTKEELRKGVNLSTPLRKMNFFPPMVTSMIMIGEESGSLDEILDKTANFYDEEVESAMQNLVALIEPLMIVLMAVVIGSIVIAMVLPMFDMYNNVNL